MYFERLMQGLLTERGLQLTFSSGGAEQSVELSPEAVVQALQVLQITAREAADGEPLTLTVEGHQVVRTPEAYGLNLHTQEFGDVVFSLPPQILQRLITDLVQLASSPPASTISDASDAAQHRWKVRARRS
jgi:hypothetical protein